MANNFVKASFLLRVTDAEAEVLGRIDDAVAILADGDLEDAVLAEHYQALGDDFARIFPPTEAGLFESFRSIFSDPDYPRLGFTLQIDPPEGTGTRQVWLSGDQVDIETAALLLQSVAKSALPIGFEYCLDCDRLRPGEFGGGYVVISANDIEFGGSARLLDRAIARHHHAGVDGFVLATRDIEDGLTFWNSEAGFGALAAATVFSDAEAAHHDVPITDDQPEWLALPAPLS